MASEAYNLAQTSRYQELNQRGSLVIDMQTNFNALGRAAAAAGEIMNRTANAKFRYMQQQVENEAVQIIQDATPVESGELRDSTYGISTQLGNFYAIEIHQDAYNTQQTAMYAPFVIMGHASRSGSWVPAQPYPEESLPEIEALLQEHASVISQEVMYDTVFAMGAAPEVMIG